MSATLKRILLLVWACAGAALILAAPASAFRLAGVPGPVSGNPANALAALPADPLEYDRATYCAPKPRPGTVALVGWLQRHARGSSWGTFRCEKWGEREASLHAENRAVDWHLNVYAPDDRKAARTLIELLLAPDGAGLPNALARRMGVQEIIWDCSYWGAGMEVFKAYAPCLNKDGELRKRVDRTIAHRDHVHLGLSKAGAMMRTSFWQHRA
jgi:hypothetical protein